MKRIALGLAGGAAVLGILCVALLRSPQGQESPVGMTPVTGPGGGPAGMGTTFVLTNRSAKAQEVYLWRVEMRQGDHWTNWSYPEQYLSIPPGASRQTTIEFVGRPPTNAWRVQGSSGEFLTGPRAVLSTLMHLPGEWSRRFLKGDTNAVLNPFRSRVQWIGNHRLVLSAEVPAP